MQEESIH